MQFHPYSEIFPLLDSAAVTELAEDIKANGLKEKIWLYEGKILDGRNRFLACKKAGIKPDTRKFTGKDPLAFVVSLNVKRRHLTPSQLAMVAAEVARLRDGERKSAAPRGAAETVTQSEAADDFGIGRRTVQRARKVIEEGSKALQEAVRSGEVPVNKAAAVADLPKSEQLAAAKKKPQPEIPPKPEFRIEDYDPAEDDEALERADQAYRESIEKVMAADDRFPAMESEVKRLTGLLASAYQARDHYQHQAGEAARLLKAEQRRSLALEKKLQRTEERIASLEGA